VAGDKRKYKQEKEKQNYGNKWTMGRKCNGEVIVPKKNMKNKKVAKNKV